MSTNNQLPGLPEQNSVAPQQEGENQPTAVAPAFKGLEFFVLIGIGALLLLTLLFLFASKKKAENVSRALDPRLIEGLKFNGQEFNPSVGPTYIQIGEGGDRSAVQIQTTGSTLPIVSRYNFQAMSDANFEVIGAAPWALTNNFAANLNDPDLMLRVLSNDKVIQAFLARPDVEPLLNDSQLLASFTEDAAGMKEFFEDDTVKAVLANEKMVRMVASSKFMSHLLTSPAVKYYRDHPQEAVAVIRNNAYLSRLQQSPYVQTAVKENPYLKSIAPVLLKGVSTAQPNTQPTRTPSKNPTRPSRRAKK